MDNLLIFTTFYMPINFSYSKCYTFQFLSNISYAHYTFYDLIVICKVILSPKISVINVFRIYLDSSLRLSLEFFIFFYHLDVDASVT